MTKILELNFVPDILYAEYNQSMFDLALSFTQRLNRKHAHYKDLAYSLRNF